MADYGEFNADKSQMPQYGWGSIRLQITFKFRKRRECNIFWELGWFRIFYNVVPAKQSFTK